jgi:outer membrane immunogenic protein
MKKLLLATSALVVIATAHPTYAADQAATPHLPTKTPIVPPAPIYNWTGCYIGAQGGGGAVSDLFVQDRTNGNHLHGGGGFGGGQIGCNYQSGNFVFGVEGEAWSGLTNPNHEVETTFAFTNNFIDRNRWSADVAVRAGLAFDRALLYGKAGIAEGRFAFSFTDNNPVFFQSSASTLTGVLLGAGLEYGFAPNWSAKLEYDHIEYPGRTVNFETNFGPSDQTESASVNLVKAGINYRFTDHFGENANLVDVTTRNRWSADIAARAGVAVEFLDHRAWL